MLWNSYSYPTKETAPIRPLYPYALTKRIAEEILIHWANLYNLKLTSLRLFNVYGTRSRTSGTYGAVFGVFLKQKLEKHPFTVVGDGTQTRDFTYVSDVVDVMVQAMDSSRGSMIYNVGSGQTVSISKITQLLGGPCTYIPKRPGEPDCTFACIKKIKDELDWAPKVTIEKGISIVLDNIDYWKKAPLWTPDKIDHITKDWFKHLRNI